MIKKLIFLLGLLAAISFNQQAMAIEEPKYDTIYSEGSFEIRRYAPLLLAETFVDGDMDEASNKGFRRIADFIFGNNQAPGSNTQSSMAMTAPVTIEPQSSKIAMTAPVTLEPQTPSNDFLAVKKWRIAFVMPSTYSIATIPKPKNNEVKLREVPSQYFVVHRYSWLNTQTRVQEKTDETLQWSRQKSLQVIGSPQLSRYDPPWTLPMFKRNEIMVEIAKP